MAVARALPALLALAASAARADDPLLRQILETRRFTAGRPTSVTLTRDGKAALFLRSPPRSPAQALYATDLATGATRELCSAGSLLGGEAATASAAEQAQLERLRITARGISRYTVSDDGARVAVALGGRLFLVERESGEARALATSGRPLDPTFSPDGRFLSYVVDHDLRLLDLSTGVERPLTTGGSEERPHGLAEFVAQEELDRYRGHWWSPDSRQVAWQETDERAVERFTIHDPLHPERPADSFRYPRAGGRNAEVRLWITSLSGGPPLAVTWDRERFPYLARAGWSKGAPLTLVVLSRRQDVLQVLAVDPGSGATRLLLEERDPAWVELPPGDLPLWTDDGAGFFWQTERSGWPEVELRRADGGHPVRWVEGRAGLARVVGWDGKHRRLWFTGGPRSAETRLYRVDAGQAPVEWSPSAAPIATAAGMAPGGAALWVERGGLAARGPVQVVGPGGALLAELPSVAAPPLFESRGELLTAGPGALDVLVTRPRKWAPGTRLPVLLQVYGGPGHKEAAVRADPIRQWIADRGWAVVSIDGRGTPRRGRDFERAIRGDFAGPALDDQVAALRDLARRLPELDLERVVAMGGSFGGYFAALAVLRYPELFRGAVADAPVVDWRDYDTAYTERYLGLPEEQPEAYRRSSLLPLAPRLSRPLLLVHGTADDNVYFFHSLKLADALLRAGRRAELLPLPGLTHLAFSAGEPAYVERLWERMLGFLDEAVAPPPRGGTRGP